MTPEERQLLSALVDRIKSAPQQEIDAEADQTIHQLTAERPDTAYLLAQTVIMQDFGMRNAQAQIADLQRQVQEAQQQPKSSGSFLGGLFGSSQSSSVPPAGPWSRPAPAYPQPQQVYQSQPVYSSGYAPVMMPPGQTSGFLRSAAQTAVGIAGGALLFEGIQSLFGHPGYGGGFMGPGWGGGGWGGGGFGPRESLSETTIVNNNTNNYFDGQPGEGEHHHQDAGGSLDQGQGYSPTDQSYSDPGFDQQDSGFQDAADYSTDNSSSDPGGSDWA